MGSKELTKPQRLGGRAASLPRSSQKHGLGCILTSSWSHRRSPRGGDSELGYFFPPPPRQTARFSRHSTPPRVLPAGYGQKSASRGQQCPTCGWGHPPATWAMGPGWPRQTGAGGQLPVGTSASLSIAGSSLPSLSGGQGDVHSRTNGQGSGCVTQTSAMLTHCPVFSWEVFTCIDMCNAVCGLDVRDVCVGFAPRAFLRDPGFLAGCSRSP